MINGVGPMNCVKNRMSHDIWRGKRTIKQPDEWDSRLGVNVRGVEATEDGILAFATAHEQVLIVDWNAGQQVPKPDNNMANMKQSCLNFAPFLFQHKMPE